MLLSSRSYELYIVFEEQVITGQFICQVIYKNQEQKGSKYSALTHAAFCDTFCREVASQFTLKVVFFRNSATQ